MSDVVKHLLEADIDSTENLAITSHAGSHSSQITVGLAVSQALQQWMITSVR